MFGDKENENMNFDSVPNISFNSNGQPVGGGFGMPPVSSFPGGEGSQNSGQFIPPAGMGIEEPSSNNNIIGNNSNSTNSSNNSNNVVEPMDSVGGDFNMFKCNSCNTTFGVSNGGVAEQCILCGKHEIVKASYNGNRIDEFIPFTISKNKAIETYKSKVMFNPIIPFCFKTSSTINSIKKVYIQ